jgi:Rhodopirellula transposase DDE domain
MAVEAAVVGAVQRRIAALWPHLNERQRRLLLGAEARELGWGGVTAVAQAAGVSRTTVTLAVSDVESSPKLPEARSRRAGGGRKSALQKDPALAAALDALVDPATRGDPESPLRWTCRSTRNLAAALTAAGHPVSERTVAALLTRDGFSLQANAKTAEDRQHPDRDGQFSHLNAAVRECLASGDPVVSVDTKKKELVGADPGYRNNGREYQPKGRPVRVGVHDFPDPAVPKAVPYGIHDLAANTGWVSVGCDGDTASFAVETLRRWWTGVGAPTYPAAARLLVCADAGGSNGYRVRLWKLELATLATEIGLPIMVCHFPPGTSKWNKIEHRLFSAITGNWRGRPLTSHEVVVELIGATTTRTGLTVHAEVDTNVYPRGLKVSDAEMDAIRTQIEPDQFHGEWNYTLRPRTPGV